MSLTELMNKKVYSRPKEGQHTLVLKSVKEVSTDSYEYLEFNTVLDDEREFKVNMFERDLSFFQTALIKELKTEGCTFGELLARAIKERTKFNVWIQYNIVSGTDQDGKPTTREFTNIYWSEPRTTTDNTATDEEFLKAVAEAQSKSQG